MSTLLGGVLPAPVATAELFGDPASLTPLPEEDALVARAVTRRRNEFHTVRHCARLALADLGEAPAAILKGDKGQPCWPAGIVGSLTHCEGYRAAAVAPARAVRSVGIDAEPHGPLPDGVLTAISLPAERHRLTALRTAAPGLHWDRVLFCAKEATYKTWFPVTGRWLGFEDADIVFSTDPGGTGGGFTSRILVDPAARSGPPLRALTGRWTVRRGLVLTAIAL